MPLILVESLVKVYGETRALDGLDLEVQAGSTVAILGPNGAGKTTLVRVLATLARPDGGRALVAGLDVVRQAAEVRRRIGIAGQAATVDEYLTGRQNLIMIGRLCRLSGRDAARRADELLEQFDLTKVARRTARTYSGGTRRKLDLAASLVIRPQVLFLDEPTTGLDPRARYSMWQVIRDLAAGGTTLLITTQYLDEADQLAQRIAVVDSGKVIAWGTSDELKAQVGGAVLEVVVSDGSDLGHAAAVLRSRGRGEPTLEPESRRLSIPADGAPGLVTQVVRALDAEGLLVDDISVRKPALDDVFMSMTGHLAVEPAEEAA